ncbi:PAS domain S-box protein, partial [Petrachloros mirabilis]
IDSDQRILLFNRAAQQMFRCSAREALGQPLDKFLPERFRSIHGQHVEVFGQSGATTRKMGQLGTVVGVRAGGEEFPIEAAISHFTVGGDKYYTVVLRDITERRHAEQLLRQSEARYRRLIEVSPFAIFIHRGERIVFTNRQGLALVGASKVEDVTNRSLLEFIHPGDMDQVKHRIHRIVHEGEQAIPAVERFIRLDGTEVDVEVVAARFVDEEGVGVEVFVRDVTERMRLEDQLKKAERLAELGTLASGMAHEIGTPMNVILGRAEYLMERVRDETVKKGLQTIVAQVERITRVMNQLLTFARRKPPEREPLALGDVIEDSLEMFHERLAKSRVEVQTQIDASSPKVRADRDQMSQVLINLIMNALHAMPEGGVLSIGMSSEGKELVKLTVADSGQGIPRDLVEKIFEPFFTTKEFGKGTGLGLTVVKGIVEEHQGTITVDSEEGKGTTFTILLPGN